VKREPQTLPTLIGSKHVPRVSILVEYEQTAVSVVNVTAAKSRSLTATPSEESDQEKYGGSGDHQNPCANIFAGDADLGVKDVAQYSRGQNRRQEYTEQVPHPKLGRVHCTE
jgi:hypothetical protein